MRFIKYIFILSLLLPAIIFSGESVDSCSVSFSNHKEFIKSFFSDLKNINQYQGQTGYIRFVAEHLGFLKMNTVFLYTSRVLSKEDMDILNWQKYHGSTKEFLEERSNILDEKGNIKKEYQGPTGYARYADEFYLGKMLKTYINVSALLSELEKKSLNWQQYQGNTKEFIGERSQILNEKGSVKKDYQRPVGYARYADEFYGGDMQKSYRNVSAVLSELEKKSLNWQSYQGSTKEFREERSKVLNEKGNIKKEYQDQEGYALYSDEFYLGDMQKAYRNVSAVLSELEKTNLNWQGYQGNTKEFRKERSNILDKTGNIKKEYQGKEGYVRYSDEFYLGNMQTTHINISAVLSKEDMQYLGWKQFKGDTSQFHSLFEFFNNHSFEDYKGPLGQKKIANTIFKNHLRNTYTNISALRAYLFSHKDKFKDLRKSGWSSTLSW